MKSIHKSHLAETQERLKSQSHELENSRRQVEELERRSSTAKSELGSQLSAVTKKRDEVQEELTASNSVINQLKRSMAALQESHETLLEDYSELQGKYATSQDLLSSVQTELKGKCEAWQLKDKKWKEDTERLTMHKSAVAERCTRVESDLQAIQTKYAALEQKHRGESEAYNRLKDEVKNKSHHFGATEQSLREQMSVLALSVQNLKGKLGNTERDAKNAATEAEMRKQDLVEYEKKVEKLKEKVTTLQDEISKKNEECIELGKCTESKNADIGTLKTSLQRSAEEHQRHLDYQQKKIAKLEEEIKAAIHMQQQSDSITKQMKRNLEEATARCNAASQKSDSLSRTLAAAKGRINDLETELSMMTFKLGSMVDQRNRLDSELAELKSARIIQDGNTYDRNEIYPYEQVFRLSIINFRKTKHFI